MRRKLLISGAFASLAFVLSSAAAEKSGSSSTPLPGGSVRKIVCHGVQNVPVTADPEQTLPLQIVARLTCGAEVAVLADGGGSTARIVTPEGQNGYVARMYLSEAPVRPKAQPVEAPTENGIARWHQGAPGSATFFTDGSLVESLTANGITVQVSLRNTDWKLRASVAIANNSGQTVHFNPAGFTLDELEPRLRPLAYLHPRGLAKIKARQAYWTNVSAIAPAAPAYQPAAYKSVASIESTPNYIVQAATQPQLPILMRRNLAPGEKASGVVWFARDESPQQLTLRVFVDDDIFEFPLSFPQHN